jgi:osmotically inducible lipoprotein OsmB
MELKAIKSLSAALLLASMVVSLTACQSMTTRQRNTAIGAGIGSVAGAALGGNMLSTLGGAAAGGLIGNQVKK